MLQQTSATTHLLITEARQRGIHVFIPDSTKPGFIGFYHRGRTTFIRGRTIVQEGYTTHDKAATLAHLRTHGFPVPETYTLSTDTDAPPLLKKFGTIVIKPNRGHSGNGVTTSISTLDAALRAFVHAKTSSTRETAVLCQPMLTGNDYRILVINKQQCFALQRIPAHVIGNGQLSLIELIQNAKIYAPNIEEAALTQGWRMDDVIPPGKAVYVSFVANIAKGGLSRDVTDSLHPSVIRSVQRVAALFNRSVLGIDVISPNISQELGTIIELNSSPGLLAHHQPDEGHPRNVAGAIFNMLFPETHLRLREVDKA